MTEKEVLNFINETAKMMRWVNDILLKEKELSKLEYDYDRYKEKFMDFLYCSLDGGYDEKEEAEYSQQEKPCYLYYILNQEKDKVKIGISINPMRRAKEIQNASGEDIELYHTIEFKDKWDALAAERYLHWEFKTDRCNVSKVSKSCEWFDARILEKYLMKNYRTREQILYWVDRYEEEKREDMKKLQFSF